MKSNKTLKSIDIVGGYFFVGSDYHYPEERPKRTVLVDGFQIDAYAVSNADFDVFVKATGHVTCAEKQNASMVFVLQKHAVDLHDPTKWWSLVAGANWLHPEGPGSTNVERGSHPVVHVSLRDAQAYSMWAGKVLPQENEWEFAAQKGRIDMLPWGTTTPQTKGFDANIWQGKFPHQNDIHSKAPFTEPVDAMAPNEAGLYNMIGNVWEWTETYADKSDNKPDTCCAPQNQRQNSQYVLKGGSYLCSPQYCARYRPEAKIFMPEDGTTSHIGFRCIRRNDIK